MNKAIYLYLGEYNGYYIGYKIVEYHEKTSKNEGKHTRGVICF